MKVVCSKENLLKGLNTVLRAVPVRTTLDILKCILIHAENDRLTFTANDTSLGIETKSEALILEEGTIALDAALFSSIVRKLPDADVTIESGELDEVTLYCEKSKFTISGREADSFINLPTIRTEGEVKVSQFTVREMINQVVFSIADSNLNAAMAGVYLEVFDNRIRMTTLDGHRISVRVNELNDSYDRMSSIIPGKTMSDLSKIIAGDRDREMRILFSRNHIVFEFENTKVVSRVIDGEYFKIDSMLREEYETHVKINKREFMDCLDRSTLFINESDKKPVIMTIGDEEISLRLKSQIGSMDEKIQIEKEGKDLKIAFNPKLLIDALRVIEDEEIDVYMVKYNYPCTIKDQEGKYIYVVLPVNFTEE